MKKINITTGILLIYLLVMAVLGWPGKNPDPDYIQYSILLVVSVGVIFALRYVQIRRLKYREKVRNDR